MMASSTVRKSTVCDITVCSEMEPGVPYCWPYATITADVVIISQDNKSYVQFFFFGYIYFFNSGLCICVRASKIDLEIKEDKKNKMHDWQKNHNYELIVL